MFVERGELCLTLWLDTLQQREDEDTHVGLKDTHMHKGSKAGTVASAYPNLVCDEDDVQSNHKGIEYSLTNLRSANRLFGEYIAATWAKVNSR